MMQPQDRKRFAVALTACAEIYARAVSEAAMGVWWDALRAFDIDAVESAFARHMRSPDVGQYMPKPADIIKVLSGTSLDGAMVAWSKVDRAVRAVGPYQSVTFDDPIIMRVLQDMSGWIALNSKRDDEWPFVGNEFRARYQGYKQRGEIPEHPRALIGLAEADNARRGISKVERTLIGDPEKARQVAQGGTDRPLLEFRREAATAGG